VFRGLQAGAMGYVVKKSAAKEVIDASAASTTVNAISAVPCSTGDRSLRVKRFARDPIERLSSRERQTLQLLAEGQGVAQSPLPSLFRPRPWRRMLAHDGENSAS